jgi:hypothetical protein
LTSAGAGAGVLSPAPGGAGAACCADASDAFAVASADVAVAGDLPRTPLTSPMAAAGVPLAGGGVAGWLLTTIATATGWTADWPRLPPLWSLSWCRSPRHRLGFSCCLTIVSRNRRLAQMPGLGRDRRPAPAHSDLPRPVAKPDWDWPGSGRWPSCCLAPKACCCWKGAGPSCWDLPAVGSSGPVTFARAPYCRRPFRPRSISNCYSTGSYCSAAAESRLSTLGWRAAMDSPARRSAAERTRHRARR